MTAPDDNHRYIEYLQKQSLAPDWEMFYDAASWSKWVTRHSLRLQEMEATEYGSPGDSVAFLERLARDFVPQTQFELPNTRAIFEPLLEEVKSSAAALGLRAIRDVDIATSTHIGATPAAWPTVAGRHILFIGLGTSSFCNYWSKAFTAVVKAMSQVPPFNRVTGIEDLDKIFRKDPSGLILAGRLSLYYATFGSLLGFGEVHQPQHYTAYRLELLRAMETFAVAHEYSHYVAQERLPQFQGGVLDSRAEMELKLFCDELGLAICRDCGSRSNSFLGFAGIGALVFFRSFQLSEAVRSKLMNSPLLTHPDADHDIKRGGCHPLLEQRIAAIKTQVGLKTSEDQREVVQLFLDEYDEIAKGIASIVSDLISQVMSDDLTE